jgi:peptide/nickel transport system substrate-binding protein
MRNLILALMLLVAAVVGANLGCPEACLAKGVDIRIADSKGDWGYPNPYRHYPRGPGYVRMSWVFDTLLWKDNGGYVPALASKWSYDPGKMSFSFQLNPKAKWHDGQPVTADDVVFTVEFFRKHPYRWVTVSYVEKVLAKGPHQVEIQLNKPYAPFISDIAGTMPILPRHIWQGVKDPKKFNDPKSFIGSGPYVFRDFDKVKGSYLFEAFGDYYQGRPKADRLIYVRSGKPLISLLTRQVDLANIKPEMATTLKQKGITVIKNERGWNKKLMINHTKAPFSHRVFRQALAHAIDRQEIIDKAHRGLASPASFGLLTVDHAMYNPNTPDYPHNPAKARELIESLGYKKGADGFYQKDGKTLAVELLASNVTVAGERVADRDGEIIKKHLRAVGIKAELFNQEQTTTDSRVKNRNFDLAISGHGGLAGDPRILAEMILSKYGAGSVNSAKYDACQELNQVLEAQMVEMDPDKRKALVFKAQELFARELPAMPLYYPDSMAAYNPDKGVDWYYTKGGISKGIPIPQNKMSLIK